MRHNVLHKFTDPLCSSRVHQYLTCTQNISHLFTAVCSTPMDEMEGLSSYFISVNSNDEFLISLVLCSSSQASGRTRQRCDLLVFVYRCSCHANTQSKELFLP